MVRRTGATLAALAAAPLVAALLPPPPAISGPMPGGDHDRAVTVRLRDAVASLDRRREQREGYDRDLFDHWVDADGDCRDTRDEVLAHESRTPVGDGCDVTAGEWFSYYDGVTWTASGDVDIDHMVPLAEAWDSGARGWDEDTRRRYANDLREERSLVAVTDNVNQSKGDQDVAEWLPERRTCRYVAEWVVVKTRWSLKVDADEKQRLRELAAGCRNVQLRIRIAQVTGG